MKKLLLLLFLFPIIAKSQTGGISGEEKDFYWINSQLRLLYDSSGSSTDSICVWDPITKTIKAINSTILNQTLQSVTDGGPYTSNNFGIKQSGQTLIDLTSLSGTIGVIEAYDVSSGTYTSIAPSIVSFHGIGNVTSIKDTTTGTGSAIQYVQHKNGVIADLDDSDNFATPYYVSQHGSGANYFTQTATDIANNNTGLVQLGNQGASNYSLIADSLGNAQGGINSQYLAHIGMGQMGGLFGANPALGLSWSGDAGGSGGNTVVWVDNINQWIQFQVNDVNSASVYPTGLAVYGTINDSALNVPDSGLSVYCGAKFDQGVKLQALANSDTTTFLQTNANGTVVKRKIYPGAGSGTLTSFSSGNLSPLFATSVATSTTTPAQTFTLSNAGAYTLFGRASGSGVPSFLTSIDSNVVPLLHSKEFYDGRYAPIGGGGTGVDTTAWHQQGDNVYGGKPFLGTKNLRSLHFGTNNTDAMFIDSSCNCLVIGNAPAIDPVPLTVSTTAGSEIDILGGNTGGNFANIYMKADGGAGNIIRFGSSSGYIPLGSVSADNSLMFRNGGNEIAYPNGNYWIAPDNGSGVAYQFLSSGLTLDAGANMPVTQATSAIFQMNSTTQGILPPRMTTAQVNAISSPSNGLFVENLTIHKLEHFLSGAAIPYVDSTSIKAGTGINVTPSVGGILALSSIIQYAHTIFTPTTGTTVNLVNNQNNIINPSGALLALTINLPSSPTNNDVVYIKFTQNITTVTYSGGTVVDGITAPTAGGLTVLTYDAGTTSWY